MATAGEQLYQEYTDRVRNAQKFKEQLEQAYNEKTNYNKDLIEQKNTLQNELYSQPAQLREEYYSSPIRNALTQENLIAQRGAATSSRLGTIVDLLNARGQQYTNILGQGQARYQNDMDALKTSAEMQLAREEAERARAAAAAASYGMGGFGGESVGGGGGAVPEDIAIEVPGAGQGVNVSGLIGKARELIQRYPPQEVAKFMQKRYGTYYGYNPKFYQDLVNSAKVGINKLFR